MGMYTEIYVNVDFNKDLPESVLNVLKAMCRWDGFEEHLEGYPSRWGYLFNSGSYYTPNTSVANLTYDDISGEWSLLGKGDIKNYGGEIQEFFEFIKPYVDTNFMGYMMYEESYEPTLMYVVDPNQKHKEDYGFEY